MMLNDGLEGSVSKQPSPSFHRATGRWVEEGFAGGGGVYPRQKAKPPQSLLTQAHPSSHCYPRISSLQPTLGRRKRRRLTDCCLSLMYEAALRIDVGEMVNSRFHQTRQDSGTVRCIICFFVCFVFFFLVCFMKLSSLDISVKKARSEKCGCVLSALGHTCFPYGDILNSLMSCLKWIQRKRVCMIYAHFGLRVLYHTLFGLF